MNILGKDGGYAPIAPGPIDSARRRSRRQTKKIKRTVCITPELLNQILHNINSSEKSLTKVAVQSR